MNIHEFFPQDNNNTIIMVTTDQLLEFASAIIAGVKQENIKDKSDDELHTPEEFAKLCRVNKSTLWRWCRAGVLTPTRIGTKTYYKMSDLKVKRG